MHPATHPTTKRMITERLRKEWMTWPKKFAAIQRQAERMTLPNGRQKTLIRCAQCQNLFSRKDVQADHIIPVGPLASTNPGDVADFKQRLFCHVGNLQALCRDCHLSKTKMDKQIFH